VLVAAVLVGNNDDDSDSADFEILLMIVGLPAWRIVVFFVDNL
jgi:hypothetical protein